MTVRAEHDYGAWVFGFGVSWREREAEVRFGPWGFIVGWGE